MTAVKAREVYLHNCMGVKLCGWKLEGCEF